MGNLIQGIKIAAYVAEIIVAGSVVIELVEKYSGRSKRNTVTSQVGADTSTENK